MLRFRGAKIDIKYIISQSKAERKRFGKCGMPRVCCLTGKGSRSRWGRVGRERFKKSAVIDYFAGKVSQITRPFIVKTMTMQTLNS